MAENEEGWKIFTLDEANALIPRLTSLMERMQRKFLLLRSEVGGEQADAPFDKQVMAHRDDPRVRELLEEIHDLIGQIEGLGCHFKGIDLGLVDFPAIINGEVAYLCWQHGEAEVGWWHGLEEGFSGRHPLDAQEAAVRPRTLN